MARITHLALVAVNQERLIFGIHHQAQNVCDLSDVGALALMLLVRRHKCRDVTDVAFLHPDAVGVRNFVDEGTAGRALSARTHNLDNKVWFTTDDSRECR